MLVNLILALRPVWAAGLGLATLAAAAPGPPGRWLTRGIALGVPAAFVLHFLRWLFGGREVLEGLVALVVLCLFAVSLTPRGWRTPAVWVGLGFFLAQTHIWDLVGQPFAFSPLPEGPGGFVSGRLLGEVAGLGLGVGLAVPTLVLVILLGRTWPAAITRRAALVVLGVYAMAHLGMLVQILAARRLLPPGILFGPLGHLFHFLQHQDAPLVLGLLWTAGGAWFELRLRRQQPQPAAANPAMVRKHRSVSRRRRQLLGATATVLLGFVLLSTRLRAAAERRTEQLPPKAVAAQAGEVRVPLSELSDGRLHPYIYTTAAGVQVPFLALHKLGNQYSAGLNYCEICGPAGYVQLDDQVICTRCGSAINRLTVGFRGGCNPVPLPAKVQGDHLVIPAAALEQQAEKFA